MASRIITVVCSSVVLVSCASEPNGDNAVAADDATSTAEGGTTSDAAVVDSAPAEHGLRGEYFDDFDDPRVTRTDAKIDFDWSKDVPVAGVPREFFSARWTGEITVPADASYTFELVSDDGVRLFIDDAKVVENWTGHYTTTDKGTVSLAKGAHRLRLEYFQLDIGASLQLFWSSPSMPRALVPTEALRPADAASTGRPPAPPYVNPVVPTDCPDPGVIRVEGATRPVYYMVCTGGSFAIHQSRDLVRWFDTGKSILPSGKAPWSANGFRNWAPEIHAVGGKYLAYFTAANSADKLAIGVASADSPLGPYTVKSTPLVDDPNPGVIDATFFRDVDGKNYLYWKRDGNAIGQPTPIFVRELAADGLSFAAGSSAVQVLTNAPSSFEGGVVEAPWMLERAGTYYLIYSANVYDGRYRTGVARASSPKGPFTKKGTPILANNAKFLGPGHGSVVRTHGTDFFVYHAWSNDGTGKTAPGGRHVLVDAITWEAGWPKIANGTPSFDPQPWP